MRVRATRGLRITNFYGNYFIRGTDLLALPNCTPDSVFAVEFGYDEQLLTASVISVQVMMAIAMIMMVVAMIAIPLSCVTFRLGFVIAFVIHGRL